MSKHQINKDVFRNDQKKFWALGNWHLIRSIGLMENLKRKQPAFTLIEVIVTIGCVSILVLVFERFLTANIKAYYQNSLKLNMTDQSINAFGYLNPDIRGATQIINCAPNTLSFYLKIGDANTTAKKLTYALDQNSQSLARKVIEPSGTPPNYTYLDEDSVSKNISILVSNTDAMPIFYYYDRNGTLLDTPCQPTQVRMIKVDLRHKGNGNYATGEISSETRIDLRNLKDNL